MLNLFKHSTRCLICIMLTSRLALSAAFQSAERGYIISLKRGSRQSTGKLRTSTFEQRAATAITDSINESTRTAFDWSKQWYPVSPIQDLEQEGPNKITLLGIDMAVWFHKPTSTWRAFKDMCPHRLVPLSEGRVENTGVLQCAYHGWEFNETGSCVKIPQLGVSEDVQTFVRSPRACATSYPVQVKQGLLWVFPSPNEAMAKAAPPPALIDELDDPDKVDATSFFFRDMPYSWEILVENLCDPSHIPFAHHGMMRTADRSNIEMIDMDVTEESFTGFKARMIPYPIGKGRYDVKFEAPCLLYYQIVDPMAKSFLGLGTYCVPTSPGRCRILARFPFKLSFKPAMSIIRRTPRWITHLSQNAVMDSDVVFLSCQDEVLENNRGCGNNCSDPNYYMPSKCDAMVTAFRKWLRSKGGGGPKWLGIPAARSDGYQTGWMRPLHVPMRGGRDALLDRYRQHTDSCVACKNAHRNMYALREASMAMGICLLVAAASGSSGLRWKTTFGFAGGCLLFVPRIILRLLIARLECVPWPRPQWRKGSV